MATRPTRNVTVLASTGFNPVRKTSATPAVKTSAVKAKEIVCPGTKFVCDGGTYLVPLKTAREATHNACNHKGVFPTDRVYVVTFNEQTWAKAIETETGNLLDDWISFAKSQSDFKWRLSSGQPSKRFGRRS